MDYRQWMQMTSIFLILGRNLTTVTSSTVGCRFVKVSGLTAMQFLRREKDNESYHFEKYGDAQATCATLEPCTAIVGDHDEGFKISTGFPKNAANGELWLKECRPLCEIVATKETFGRSLFLRRCSSGVTLSADDNGVTWSSWGEWGACTQTCGRDGVQTRVRSCLGVGTSKESSCSITDQEFRTCESQKDCQKNVRDIYGIIGPEGFVIASNRRIYKSCVHQEVHNRLPCGDQRTVDRAACERFKCCHQETWQEVGGPKCFQSQSFIGSIGRLGWAIWGTWSSCTVSCGNNGRRMRTRMCTGGVMGSPICQGSDREIQICGSGICPCDSSPCLNGGTCIPSEDMLYGYRCACSEGYSGRNCLYGEPDLKCGDDSITIQFHEGLVVDDGLIPDVGLIHFQNTESEQCFANKKGSMFFLALPPPIDKSCGSQIYVSDDKLTIRNKVLWKLSDGFFDATVVLVDISCVYNKQIKSSVGLGFGIQPKLRVITEQRVVEAFKAKMFLYRDDSFLSSRRFRVSPKISQGELLYASIDLDAIKISQFSSMSLRADDCWVKDALDETTVVQQLLQNGCPTNEIFVSVLQNGESHHVKLAIRVFDWKNGSTDSDQVFFQCSVRACTEHCAAKCGNITAEIKSDPSNSLLPPSGRRRRHVLQHRDQSTAVLIGTKITII